MTAWLLPLVVAAILWWLSTGVVLLLDGLPRSTYRLSLALASVVALAALAGIAVTADDGSVAGAYLAFCCALALWGWQELSFLTGWITGPRKRACDHHCSGAAHFWHAVQAIAWHELALAVGAVLVAALTWRSANQVALLTYGVLWVMRTSAKLNLHFGVRNLNAELLPPHLAYLASFFRRRRINPLLPIAVAAASVVMVLLAQRAAVRPDGEATGLLLVAALLGLAIIEHLLMVLPLDISALWRWAQRGTPARASTGK